LLFLSGNRSGYLCGWNQPAAERGETPLFVIGRLKNGVSARQATAELDAMAAHVDAVRSDERLRVEVESYTIANTDESFRRSMATILIAALLLYFLCASNLLHAILVTNSRREQELAIRTALGASRRSLARTLWAEWAPLVALSGALAVGLAQLGIVLFVRIARASNQLRAFWVNIHLDLAAALLLFFLAATVSLLALLVPIFYSPEAGIRSILGEGGSILSSSRVLRASRMLAVAKVAVSASLLIPALLVTSSLAHLWRQGRELQDPSILTAKLSLYNAPYPSTEARSAFFERLVLYVATLPGTQEVALSNLMPTEGRAPIPFDIAPPHQSSGTSSEAWRVEVSPGFFRIFPLHLLRGRYTEATRLLGKEKAAVVSRSFAERYLGGVEAAVGARVRAHGDGEDGRNWFTVAGVVTDLQLGSFERPVSAEAVYLPFSPGEGDTAYVYVKSHRNTSHLASLLRRSVASADPRVAWSDLRTMDEVVIRSAWTFRFFGMALILIGSAAFAIAILGVYSVISFAVAFRQREMGLRSALGACSLLLQIPVRRSGQPLGAAAPSPARTVPLYLGSSRTSPPRGLNLSAHLQSLLPTPRRCDLASQADRSGGAAFRRDRLPCRKLNAVLLRQREDTFFQHFSFA
jgi:putative ABC transport system permease protein